MKRHVFLTGFMGAGKSVVGAELSRRLRMDFRDLDREIEKIEGLSVNDVFESRGEGHFRRREAEVLESLCRGERGAVISTGGGCVLSERNRETMSASGHVFYLMADVDTLWGRVRGRRSRPLLNVGDPYGRLRELFAERREVYELCGRAVSTDDAGVSEVADRIVEILEETGGFEK